MANLTLKRFEQEKELILAQMRAEALPFEDDSPLAKRERKERTRYDVLEFAKTYMPHYVPGEYSEYHEELKDYTNTENEPIFFSGPKGTGKSVLVTIVDYVRRSVNKLNHFMIILGQTEDQASDRAAYIQFEIENNPRIKQDFGDLRGSWLWEKKDFCLKNGCRIKSRGIKQQVAGLLHRNHRPDAARGEDLEDEMSVKNPDRTKELKNWILEVVLGGVGENFSFIWGGNIISKSCALYKLIKERDEVGEKRYKGQIFKLLQDGGTNLCPGIWSIERIERMKRILGVVSFNKVYQNDPIDPLAKFRPEWFEGQALKTRDVIRRNLLIKCYNDPMVKPSSTSDSCAILVAGIDLDQMNEQEYLDPPDVIFIDAVIRKLTRKEMMGWHYTFQERWRLIEHWFESVAFSEWLQGDFDLEAKFRGYSLNVRPYNQKRIHKDVRVDTLTGPAERRKLYFCTDNGDIPKLIEQFLYYGNPGVPKDGPDAGASLYDILNHGGSSMYVYSEESEDNVAWR